MLNSKQMGIKIAYIGGGSKNWARVMLQDLALAEGLCGEIALYDLDLAAAETNAQIGQQIFQHKDAVSQFKTIAYANREEVLKDADFVFISILPGPMSCFANDLDIPARYGLVQTVGDTIGPGGLSRSLRTIPIYAELAHAIAEHCPDAWVINYTNPMTVATQALTEVVPGLKTIGCCHEVFACREWIGSMAAEYYGIPMQHRNEVEIEVVGLNHFTFFPWARYHGKDVFPAIQAWIDKQEDFFGDKTANALAREAKGRFGSCDGLIQLDFFRQFGVFGAAGDRHLVEFVPWYCRSEDELRRWGVSLTKSEQRLKYWKPDNVSEVPDAPENLKKSKEEGIDLVRALCGLSDMYTNVNVPNLGQIHWLPEGHVVETMATVSRDSVKPSVTGPIPAGLQTHIERIADIQSITMAAALERSHDLAMEALLADPLMTIGTDKARAMLDEMIAANAEWLPEEWTR